MTALLGGSLLAICILWSGWLFFYQPGGPYLSPSTLLSGLVATPTANQPIAPLLAQGITLRSTEQKPALSQQQAVEIAKRLEPDAASKAKSTSARYALLTYPMTNTPATHPDWDNVEVWMIWYQQIPQSVGDTSFDSSIPPRSYHDLYVFLDANSGQELFSLLA